MKTAFGMVLIGLLSLPGASVAQAAADDEREVRSAEERHRAAFLARDLAALEAMLSDDFAVNSPRNTVIQKKPLLELVRGGALALSSYEQQIDLVRRYGDVVAVMGGDTVTYVTPSPNAGQTQRRRFTDLWRQQGGRWVLIARQAGIICP